METSHLDILGKYFGGSITEDELTILSKWIEESEKNKQEFLTMYRIWNSLEFNRFRDNLDIDKELNIFRDKVQKSRNRYRQRRKRTIIISFLSTACAAIIIALVLNLDKLKLSMSNQSNDIMSFVNATTTDFTTSKDIHV